MMKRPCPACDRRVAGSRGYVNGIEILRCDPCGSYYMAELGLTDFVEIYEDYYTHDNLGAPDFVAKSLDRIFAGFRPYRTNNRMLDVGFGAATTMLAGVRDGWNVEGIEISEDAVKHAHELGLNAVSGELQDVGYPDNHFDTVVCSEVLEHVPHPRQLAEEIVRVLRPGGLMWATTPHGLGISSRILGLEWSVMCPPEHLQLFSYKGLRHLLIESGFKLERLITETVNPLEIVHDLRARMGGEVSRTDEFDRVHSNYEILDAVYSRRSLTFAKHALHAVLHATRLGDSLKVWATKVETARG